MKSINQIVLTAGITKDVEVKTHTDASGKTFHNCSLNLAFTKTVRDANGDFKEESMYITGYYVVKSDKLLPLLTKGTQVLVTASLDQFLSRTDQSRITCLRINDLRLMSRPDVNRTAEPVAPKPEAKANPAAYAVNPEDNDFGYVPF